MLQIDRFLFFTVSGFLRKNQKRGREEDKEYINIQNFNIFLEGY